MEAALGALAQSLAATGVSAWARADAYPVVNTLHLLGLVMLIGAIGIVDLRVAGLWRALPLPALSRALTPVGVAGLVLLVITGSLLFAADGTTLARSATFHAKLALIAIALVNAAVFHMLPSGREPGALVRLVALLSLGLWLMVATLGRLIAYQ